jgi:hypothetical protein
MFGVLAEKAAKRTTVEEDVVCMELSIPDRLLKHAPTINGSGIPVLWGSDRLGMETVPPNRTKNSALGIMW